MLARINPLPLDVFAARKMKTMNESKIQLSTVCLFLMWVYERSLLLSYSGNSMRSLPCTVLNKPKLNCLRVWTAKTRCIKEDHRILFLPFKLVSNVNSIMQANNFPKTSRCIAVPFSPKKKKRTVVSKLSKKLPLDFQKQKQVWITILWK